MVRKYIKQNIIPKICSTVPLWMWHSLVKIDLVIPHWHVVEDHELEHISGIYKFRNLREFKSDLEFFLRNYHPISLQDIINHLEGKEHLHRRCFLATFDDGFREAYEIIAPILKNKGIPAVFFLITSVIDNHELCYPQKKSLIIRKILANQNGKGMARIERVLEQRGIEGPDLISRVKNIYYLKRGVLDEIGALVGCDFGEYVTSVRPYLTSVQIRTLIKNGFDIGAHSIDHPLYSELTVKEQINQTRKSVEWISNKFAYDCKSFAFPYSDYGITSEYFQEVFSDKKMTVTFGIGKILGGAIKNNLPRFSMERTELPANQILSRQLCKALFLKASNK